MKLMNRQHYEKLNDLSISFDHLMLMIELAEHMTGEFICGNVTDNEEMATVHMDRLWSLLNGMVELSHARHREFEELLKFVPIIEDAPEQSAKD